MTSGTTHQPRNVPCHNLPVARSSFVGREGEIAEVKRALETTSLLTLTGAGGSGKTRLALEVARSLVEDYPDGVWLAEFAPLSKGTLVPETVAKTLGIPERPGEPLADTLMETLGAKDLLMVFDNCEHLADDVARLVDALLSGCPGVRILATSREALDVTGEVRLLVLPLPVPDPRHPSTVGELESSESARLFSERARQRNSAFILSEHNARPVAEICRRLEGIPLAIELAAARVGTLSPEQISERLERPLKLLTGGGRTASPRQRTLSGALDWSYELLSGPEKVLLPRLSVFAGGWTLEAAEAVASSVEGIEEGGVMDLLSGLVEKSLVIAEMAEQGDVRYRLLEPIRQYALEKLEHGRELEDLKRSHAQYFLTLAEEAEPELVGPREAEWFERLEAELDNIRAALSWAQERGEAEFTLRLAGALLWFWYLEGHYREGRGWLEAALADESRTSAARPKALGAAGWLAFAQGDLARARAATEEGLGRGNETRIGYRERVFLLHVLGAVCGFEGDYERAERLSEEALALSRRANYQWGIGQSLTWLAIKSTALGDHERAERLFGEAQTVVQALGSTSCLCLYLFDRGSTALVRGDHERARLLNEQVVGLARKHERRFVGVLGYALCNLGRAALLGDEPEQAGEPFGESLMLSARLGDKTVALEALAGLACVAASREESERAARLFGAAETLREATGYRYPPRESAIRERHLSSARSRLEESRWEEAFAEGKAMGLERAIELALSELETSATTPSARPEHPFGLTAREAEVLGLVAEGLTNPQVAERLYLSPRTVQRHLNSVYRKLAVSSRAAAARLAVERGLL